MEKEDPVMKMYEAQAEAIMVRNELEQTKKELEKVKQQRDELQRMLLQQNNGAQLGNSSDNSGSILGLEFKVQDMQMALAELSKKLDNVSEKNFKNYEDIKKKMDFSSRPPKFDKQHPKNSNNTFKKDGNNAFANNRQENFNPEKLSRPNEAILIFGGKSGHEEEVYMLDYYSNLWNTFTLPREKLYCQAAVHLNGEIYFIGSKYVETDNSNKTTAVGCRRPAGRGTSSRKTVLSRFQSTEYRNYFYKLTADFTWKDLSTTENGYYSISKSCVAYNNCIWIIGGRELGRRHTIANLVEKYDPITDFWTQMPPLNCPRTGASAIVVREKIYVCGGNDTDKKVECFDPTSEQWIIICTVPTPRNGLAIAAGGNYFVLLGGDSIEGITTYTDVWKISLENDGAARCIGMTPLPQGRGSCSAICYGNTIVAIGGYMEIKQNRAGRPSIEITRSVSLFNGKFWREGPALPGPKAGYHSVIIPLELGNKLVNKFG